MQLKLKPLPIGESDIVKIMTHDFLYVDKTEYIYELIKVPGKYFLSRPRRFGKSTILSTLYEVFKGNKEIFKQRWIYGSSWDWQEYPIIRMDFNAEVDVDLIEYIRQTLRNIAIRYNVYNALDYNEYSYGMYFRSLIDRLNDAYKKNVVILIDEYDKPMLDVIENQLEVIKKRDILKSFYTTIKGMDDKIRFVFLTGVSKFSKINLFSGLNNLNDITLHPRYADICGYTQQELELTFAEYLSIGNVNLAKLKQWYNGYNFGGGAAQKVYNPFDILLFFDNNYIYKNYWFQTGSPSFLIKLVEQKKYFIPELESVIIRESDLSSFDVDNIPIPILLFQTGYLTIKDIDIVGTQLGYLLTYPNLEVKASLNDSLTSIATTSKNEARYMATLDAILKSDNLDDLGDIFSSHFAGIPNDWYRSNNIANYEGFYSSVVYSYFCALGYEVVAEDTTNHGKIDLVVITFDKVLILEFKLNKYGTASDAISQIKAKRYAEKYLSRNKPVYFLGMSFDCDTKNVSDLKWELFQGVK